MIYTLSQMSTACNAVKIIGNANAPIDELYTDSRKVNNYTQGIFFALVTAKNNGHKYIDELIDAGLKNFVVQQLPTHYPDTVNFILVENTLLALQNVAAFHRKQFSYPVIAITGSNGKTIVKEWLYQLLKSDLSIVRSPKSFNSQIGVPLSVWQMNKTHDIALIEAGISMPNEMTALQAIINPTQCIITNIGDAHDENFKNSVQKINEKLLLTKSCKEIYYNTDQQELHQIISNDETLKNKILKTWSTKLKADLQIGKILSEKKYTSIQGVFNQQFVRITIPFTDLASIENAITCWLYLLSNHYHDEQIAQRMLQLTPVAMRLELKDGINNCLLINDSYSADMESLSIALDFLNQQKQQANKTVILSDIEQINIPSKALYTQINNLLQSKKITRLLAIGENISAQKQVFTCPVQCFTNTKAFIDFIPKLNFNNETILLKGARSFEFERIVTQLQHKTHTTTFEINLNAIQQNYNYYKNLIAPQTKIMAMVKASGYGSGSFEIASLLQYLRVDYLAVAYADEGVELRNNGIRVPIMVMNPDEQAFDTMIKNKLEPEIYSFKILNEFITQLSYHDLDAPVGIHIELDTGMHRLGFDAQDVHKLATTLRNEKNIIVKTIFSHFVGSDSDELNAFSEQQISQFKQSAAIIQSQLNYTILLHMCNSAAIHKFNHAHFDMVRLGIGLYGIASNENEKNKLSTVSKLKSIVSQIKAVDVKETIGYNRNGKLNRNSTIATIPVGYADGLHRLLGNGVGSVEINNTLAPIVGNVCMDMCMVDITDVPHVNEGDEVTIFGGKISIYDLANQLKTIPYEILTTISKRVKRVYYQE